VGAAQLGQCAYATDVSPLATPGIARDSNTWSGDLPLPMAHQMQVLGETEGPLVQALRPGVLTWDAFPPAALAQSPLGTVKPFDAAARGSPGNHACSEQQRLQQLPGGAGVAQQSGGATCDATLDQCHNPSFAGTDGEESSLRSYLNYLKQIDAGRILLARKINRLGFDSAAVLAAHYAVYGQVEHVFVPRSRSVARSQSNRPFVRKRPSGIGFVVMAESQGVNAILQDGEAQTVAGVTVYLQRFRRQLFSEDSEEVS